MSCITSFHLFNKSQQEALHEAKQNEKKEVREKFLFVFRRRVEVGEKYFWQWLEENAAKTEQLDTDGFLFAALTSEFYTSSDTITELLNQAGLDDYSFLLDHDNANAILGMIQGSGITKHDFEVFAKNDMELQDNEWDAHYAESYLLTHEWICNRLKEITENHIGVFYLSY